MHVQETLMATLFPRISPQKKKVVLNLNVSGKNKGKGNKKRSFVEIENNKLNER